MFVMREDGNGATCRYETLRGYVLDGERTVEDILEVESALLRSEDIDPAWPGFDREEGNDSY